MADLTFFSAQASNGSSASKQSTGEWITVSATGTWDGATLTYEISMDDTTWVAVSDATFTADGIANVQLAPGTYIRATLSSVGTTSIDCLGNQAQNVGLS